MVSKQLQDYIKTMPGARQTAIGREMLEMQAKGTPAELVELAFEKKFNLVKEVANGNSADIKQALGEILSENREAHSDVKKLKADLAKVSDAVSNLNTGVLMPYNTDLEPISPKDFGITVAPLVDVRAGGEMSSKIVIKEEIRRDDTAKITEMLRVVQGEIKNNA